MIIKKLIETRKTDVELTPEIRAALIESLFAPVVSLVIGAVACSIIGAAVALRADSPWIMANSVAIFAVGVLRVVSALLYRKYEKSQQLAAHTLWEHVFECGAWAFSALLGLLCWLTITQSTDTSLQMAIIATSTGYAAAVSSRNAGRPFIAVGQLTLCTLPMSIALLGYPDWVHKTQGFVILLFIYGMMDITLSIRDIIIQALTMTRKEAALAARFQEQANRFDIALNNMSHGLCMLDPQDRLQVWNERFLELLHLQKAPMRVGMRISQLVRHSIRAGNHKAKSAKDVITDLINGLQHDRFEQFHTSPDGDRTIAVSRRMMAGGGSVVILEDVTERKRTQERITHLARFDELTGLANRAQFRERINGMLAAVHQNHLTIHLVDLDRFKLINDTLGHPIGDKLLKEVAFRLSTVIKPADMITRFGGDEFVVLQTGTDAEWLAQRLARTFKEPFEIDGHRIDIGASIGIAMAPNDGVDVDQLLKKADMALYAAKNGGGGNHRFFAMDMEAAVQERRALELDLRDALGSGQFDLNYQPLIDLKHRPRHDLRGADALDPSGARGSAAGGVHTRCRRDRPDHRARRMGLEPRLRRGGALAARCQGCRQPVAGPGQEPRHRLAGGIGTGEVGAFSAAARAGSHRALAVRGQQPHFGDNAATQQSRGRLVARRLRHRLFLAQLLAQVPLP